MDLNQLHRLYGHRCQAVFHCHPCGRSHSISGTLSPGRLSGDVVLEGLNLAVSDLVSVNPEQPLTAGHSAPRLSMPYLWLAWLLLAWLMAVARR